MDTTLLIGILIPFLGTVLGSAMVFLMRGELSEKMNHGLEGFAAGAGAWSGSETFTGEGILCWKEKG